MRAAIRGSSFSSPRRGEVGPQGRARERRRSGGSVARSIAALAALLLLAPMSAGAQWRGGGDRAGDFDFYVLSLSWSPSYCRTSGDRAPLQCGAPKPFAFVTHGLWPQYERGFPSDCRVTGRQPTRAQVDDMLDLMPSPGLVRHEWRKHGTCSGLNPPDYFATIRDAVSRVTIPDAYRLAERDRDVSPADVERAFVDANPRLRPAMIAVGCRNGALDEVRICMTKDLDFRACGEVDRRGCRAGRVSMPAAR